MKNQFSSGNYNSWDELVRITLPFINKKMRNEIIPSLDNVLISMLGYGSEEGISKQSIDVSQIFENNSIKGVRFEVSYFVDDFLSPGAPKEAIDEDCESIKNAVTTEDIKVSEISIDVQKGILKICFETMFEEYNRD